MELALAVLSFFPHPKSVLQPKNSPIYYLEPIETNESKSLKNLMSICFILCNLHERIIYALWGYVFLKTGCFRATMQRKLFVGLIINMAIKSIR